MQDVDTTTTNDDSVDNPTNDEDNRNAEKAAEAGDQPEEITLTQAELDAKLDERAKEQDRRWKEERIPKLLGDDGKESGQKGDKEDNPQDVADALLARLEARGVVDPEIQQYLIDAGKREGKHPVDLLKDQYFLDRVDAMKKEQEHKAATPNPTSRQARVDRANDVAYWAKQLNDKGKSAPTVEMRRKVREHLAGK